MALNAIIVLLFTPIVLHWTQNKKAITNMSLTAVLYLLGFGMLAVLEHYAFFIISTFIWTIGEIIMVTNFSLYIMDHSPLSHRSRIGAIFQSTFSVGSIIGAGVGGVIIKHYGVHLQWVLMAVLGLAAYLGFIILGKNRDKQEKIV